MNRALFIPEVLHKVMGYLHPTAYDKNAKMRATLLSAALTCSSFSGPALDVLWYSMDNLGPLFKLLPNFRVSVKATMCHTIWGRVPEDHISVFNTYARRIRRYEPEAVHTIDISAYNCILRLCGRTYLLPNLIYFRPLKFDHTEVSFVLAPGLQEVCLSPRERHGGRAAGFLNTLQTLSPNLVVLRLEYVVLDHFCLSVFGVLTRLEELLAHNVASEIPLTLDFLLDISAQHTLRRLSLKGRHLKIMSSSQKSINRDPIVLSALESIDIDCALDMEAIATLLHHTMFPVLKDMNIGIRDKTLEPHLSAVPGHWHHFFDNISGATTDRLKILNIKGSSNESSIGLHLFDIPELGSLSLTWFAVDGPFLSLNHDDVRTIVDAWPHLTTLLLPHCNHNPGLEFTALITIARDLPQLEVLELSVNATDCPKLDAIPVLCHGLLDLRLINSPMKNVKLIAQSLDRLFPNLKYWKLSDPSSQLWNAASDLLQVIQQARKDEARRMAIASSGTSLLLHEG